MLITDATVNTDTSSGNDTINDNDNDNDNENENDNDNDNDNNISNERIDHGLQSTYGDRNGLQINYGNDDHKIDISD